MSTQEVIEHEAIKNMLKLIIISNAQLTDEQKQQAMNNIDDAARNADWLLEILRACGYIK